MPSIVVGGSRSWTTRTDTGRMPSTNDIDTGCLVTQNDAFIQAIIENPDDESLRLIYADWLDERNDPRGEFIRVQCELAGMSEDDPRRADLETRERHLLARHEEKWVEPLRHLAGDWDDTLQKFGWKWAFRQGFVEAVGLTAGTFIRAAADLFRLAPI